MEKLQVGEYVRTNQGYIAKLEDIDKEFMYFDDVIMCYYEKSNLLPINMKMLDGTFLKAEDYIVNHSFDIKDLVEKGDFVNGYEVDDFDGYDEEGNYFENDLGIPIYDDANMDCIVEYRPIRLMEIKSIVTKEQFKAMEYEVKYE